MRLVLTHQYFRVDASVVWDTVKNDLGTAAALLADPRFAPVTFARDLRRRSAAIGLLDRDGRSRRDRIAAVAGTDPVV